MTSTRLILPRALLLTSLLLLAGCRETLLKDLTQTQANEVAALLYKSNIDAHKEDGEKGKYRISVDKSDFTEAVEILSSHQIPSPAPVEIDQMFPGDALVATPLAERARLLSAIERRLEQTLRNIDHVVYARVHASYDLSKDDALSSPKRVAVMMTYEGEPPEALFVEKIKHLIKNSIPDVDYANISVSMFAREPRLALSNPSKPYPWPLWAALCVAFAGLAGLVAWRGKAWLARARRRMTGGATIVPGAEVTGAHVAEQAALPKPAKGA